ncbi:uncharacterized protein BDW47DRAFT_122783 [Aspergillus candidus]|uniref:Acetyl-CoA synthetase-like protein n=1 Tax=Aspergillus candidus TaxID=41067 RepID=A0A2I2FKQ0_ASPCN|nr:hypothetical protein BDW47DRAFT_122783 [Aspergillus candidus]PLB41218.1 hypothetical protein BDW47DRAFT_122783 [Aspergillus candidus]
MPSSHPPINPEYGDSEARVLLQRIQPSLLLTSSGRAANGAANGLGIRVAQCLWDAKTRFVLLEPSGSMSAPRPMTHLCSPAPDDGALMLFTSGTTGTPKGIILTHQNLLTAVRILIRAQSLSPTDRCAIITPLFHVAGVGILLLSTLFSGGAAVIPASLSGAFWSQLEEHAVTWFHGVPTLHRLLLTFPRPPNMRRLRFVSSGGSSLAQDTLHHLETELGSPVLERYGMTETAPGIFCNSTDRPRRSSCYPIPPEVTVRILHSSAGSGTPSLTDSVGIAGEVCLKGANVMEGYVDNADANADAFVDGFFRTGDLGRLESDGYLRLVGRIKEVINKGGEKIDPTEVEHLLLGHESIRDVACFRVSDEMYGEHIGAAIVLKAGCQLKPLEVKKHVRNNAIGFKVPKKVVFLDTIPCNRTGKYQRVLLSQQYGG